MLSIIQNDNLKRCAVNSTDEEFNIFQDMTIRFLEKEVEPFFEEWEEQECMPKSLWTTMGDAGLLGIDMPEQYGGAEAPFDITQMIIYQMSKMCFAGLSTGYNIHANIVMPYILNLGTEQQKQHWIPKMISGDIIGALAMTEPGAGSDLAAMKTKAVKEGNEWVLSGSKIFITNGMYADLVIVCAKTSTDAGAKGISLFLVDTSLPGFSRGKKLKKIGQHTSDTAELYFDNLRISHDCLLGELDKGFVHLMTELPRERLGCAIQAIGANDGVIEETINYVKDRQVFGQAVGKFQNTRFKLAELKAQQELCRTYLNACTEKLKTHEMTAEDAAILKLTTTQAQCKIADECLQLFGGYGYTREYKISRFYADARIQTIYGGTSEIMKEVIARTLLGR
ncbi:acyl-CoA dehydrogenase [Colwellia psychrerythraea]|uniref:Acyl-CoA dehydrogenase n=1 Tax=Colwellia psychrerythraea TaxID=28229 RepID=A0A1Y5EM70_COLPS|nr:acyl-CoA dehydrogenase [Colwellia psychrerythraea]